MSWPEKPGDTFIAHTIGTWPELPDPPFDTKAENPEWYAEHDFTDPCAHVMRYGGPKGELVVTLADGAFTYAQPDGTVLLVARWNPTTRTWDEEKP